MPLAPTPNFPERVPTSYDTVVAPGVPQGGGPLYFEEGLGTDTDIPNDFQTGALQGYITAPGRPNHNANVYEKPAEETMAERTHVGSASWVEAPTYLREFAVGSFADSAQVEYQEVTRNGGHQYRPNPAVVSD